MKAVVNNIIKFSNVDGPGNRTAVFFQGCNYKCLYCHNPETINRCNNCGDCVVECPVGALAMENSIVKWNKKKCIDCDQCIKICKFYSSPKVEEYTVEGLVKEIEKLRIFIQGVTVSGGEATLNIKFITEFFKEVKKMNLSTFVDTNGSIDLSLDKYTEFLEVSDKFMLDIKAWNESEHRELTNADNKIVLKNLEFLLKKNKMFEVRTVVNSMINAKETVLNVAKVLKDYKNVRYKIIAYRPFGVKEELKDKLLPLPKNEELEELKKIVEKTGDIEVILL
ncbi:MAG: YjjW family glycine radical enzyme activase [Sebaldella sp.]|nr:YjjW family glycine radical enzyme activase [Sebaldella sp.]